MRYYVVTMVGLLIVGFIFVLCSTKKPKMEEYEELDSVNILAEIEYIMEGE